MKIGLLRTTFLVLLFLAFSCLALAEDTLYLNKVILTGAQKASQTDIIKSLELEPQQIYNSELITTIKNGINAYFIKQGYYFATVEHTDIIPVGKDKVDLEFQVNEGRTGYISDLRFNGNRYFSADKLKQFIDITDVKKIKINQLPEIQNRILNLYTSRGYLFTLVSLDSLSVKDSLLIPVIKVDEGPVFKADNFRFSGNKVTRATTLLKISGLSQSRFITPDVLTQAEDNLLRKTYIKSCKIAPLDARTLSIEIEEAKMTKLEGIFGLTTNPNTQKRNLNGFFNVQFLNLWGTDRALTLYWKNVNEAYQILELSFHESGIKDYPYAGDITFQRTRQDSTATFPAWVRMNTELQLYFNSLYHKIGTDISSETLYPGSADSLKTNYLKAGLFWEYTKNDYSPNPRIGNSLRIKYGWVYSKTSDLTKTTPSAEFDATQYIPFKQKFVLAVSMHYREISDSKAKQDVWPYEINKMGGFRSIRGYYEDEFSSWRLGWINTEIRYLIDKDSRAFILIDDGFLQTGAKTVKTDLAGVGIGMSFKTKLGVMSTSYALSITNKRISPFSSGMLHVGLESSF